MKKFISYEKENKKRKSNLDPLWQPDFSFTFVENSPITNDQFYDKGELPHIFNSIKDCGSFFSDNVHESGDGNNDLPNTTIPIVGGELPSSNNKQKSNHGLRKIKRNVKAPPCVTVTKKNFKKPSCVIMNTSSRGYDFIIIYLITKSFRII